MKQCNFCGELKSESEFCKRYRKCKSCRREYNKKYYERNKKLLVIKYREYRKDYYQRNKEKMSKKAKEYNKKYYTENKKKINERNKEYIRTHKEQRKKYIKNYARKYYKENSEYISKCCKDRYRNELKYRLSRCISTSIRKSLKKGKNGYHWENLLGYTLTDLIQHLEKTLPIGMTWQDYLDGKLHLDHITPISVFNFDSYNQLDFGRCWALNNLQLLEKTKNIRKNNKIYESFQPSLKI